MGTSSPVGSSGGVENPPAWRRMSKVVHAAQRLTAQPLKFRVALSSVTAEGLPQGLQQAKLVWSRGAKKVSTGPARIDAQGKVAWQSELAQVVTMYFNLADGNLQANRKGYSFKVKDVSDGATVAKVSLDLAKYCKLESFKRTWLELDLRPGAKLFFLLSTELVESQSASERNQSSEASLASEAAMTTTTMTESSSSKYRSFVKDTSSSLEAVDLSLSNNSSSALDQSMIQECIDILHSSSSEDGSDGNPPSKWQSAIKSIARRMTPGHVSNNPQSEKVIARRHTVAVGVPGRKLLFSNEDEDEGNGDGDGDGARTKEDVTEHPPSTAVTSHPSPPSPPSPPLATNPFGAVPADDEDDVEDDSPHDSHDTDEDDSPGSGHHHDDAAGGRELREDNESLRDQCDILRQENAVLKQKLQQMSTPRSDATQSDMLEELIETKLKLAEAQSRIDELRSMLKPD
mmetsp:Transcript_10245/g.25991  ORF Transcript_10245/g.25991 Transcript_10245/m.25991 type:complete len:459 (-) Transcript_10245:232-1608(-)